MGIYIKRPVSAQGFGKISTSGNGAVLADQNDSTWAQFSEAGGFPFSSAAGSYIASFSALPAGAIPTGRSIVGARIAQRYWQDSSRRGIPQAYITINDTRVDSSRLYQWDGYAANIYRPQSGPFITKGIGQTWSVGEIDSMGAEGGWVAHPSNPSSNNDSRISEVSLEILYSEPIVAPTMSYPASGSTINTSDVDFQAIAPAPQAGQAVRPVFQVARNSGFTSDVRQFFGDYHERTATDSKGYYTSNPDNSTFTDLGPGLWYVRVLSQDIVGTTTAYSAATTFTITHDPMVAPVNTSPAPNAISTNPYGVRSARIDTAPSDLRKVGIEWQYSKVDTFASGVVTWKNLAGQRGTGTISYDALPKAGVPAQVFDYNVSADDPSQYLTQGKWYYRSRIIDRYSQTSPWSNVDSFTVQHAPLAQNVSPTSGAVIDQNVTPVRWTFGDPWTGDAQTAYQVKVYDQNNALIYDSNKISSVALEHMLALAGTYLYQSLRFTINVWDKDNVTAVNVASNNFVFSNSPAIVQSYPAQNEIVLTGQPTFQWSPGINRPGTTQRSFELKIYRSSDNSLIYTSGVVTSSTARSHTPPNVVLRNATAYRETLRIVDSDGLSSTLNRNFTAEYQAPPEPTVTVNGDTYRELGYASISWAGTVPDDYFVAWKIYRRLVGTTNWVLLKTETDSSVAEFRDWLAPSVNNFQYSVTQLADRSGVVLESGLNEDAAPVYIMSEDYWLIVEGDNSKNVRLYSVVADSFDDEIEMNDYIVKGRGRRVNYGTEIGMSGSLSVQLRYRSGYTAREQRQVIRDLQYRANSALLRDPFGNITKVALGQINTKRMEGVGVQEFADLTIPYMEVR